MLDDAELERMIALTVKYKDRVDHRFIEPTVNWRNTENKVVKTEEPALANGNGHK